MKYLQNLHTHCTYCDGTNTMEQLVKKAIDLGFDTIGFSSHAPMPFETGYAIQEDQLKNYSNEAKILKRKYQDSIKVLCGLETDYFSVTSKESFDYIIGSVHVIKIGDQYYDIDYSLEYTERIINDHFCSDSNKYAKAYYETMAKMPKVSRPDIIGHFDLLTKFNEIKPLIDTESKEYKKYAVDALYAVTETVDIFELNTGAISRGYRKTPYPSPFILKEIKKAGGKMIITSDCHNMEYLDKGFDTGIELLRCCGFEEVYVITDDGFKGIKI